MRFREVVAALMIGAVSMSPAAAGQSPPPSQAATPALISADPRVAARLRAAEAWIGTQMAQDNMAGMSIAIVHDQEVVWSRGFGYANTARRVRATPQTRYSICSISKLFTSIAAMRERDAGRLDIDAPVNRYLPWFNIRDVERPDGPVTARAIMSHVAGLPREAGTPYWSDINFPDAATVQARLPQQTNLYRAYDQLQYSNLGMTLLGDATAAAARQPYHHYIRTNLLQPLGLTRTTSELPNNLHGGEFAVGYTTRRGWSRDPMAPYTLNAIAPAAGFASTAEDLGRFASWQFRLLRSGGEEVIRSSTLREMHRVHWMTPDEPNQTWGLGFVVMNIAGKTFVGHGGYCPGYRSTLLMRPQDRIGIVVLTNTDDADPDRFAEQLYALVGADIVRAAAAREPSGPAPQPRPAAASAPPAPAVDLSIYEGVYLRPRASSDMHVAAYGNELMVLRLFEREPAARITRLRHVDGHRFRRVRTNDQLAEEWRFETDSAGRVTRAWAHDNYLDRRR